MSHIRGDVCARDITGSDIVSAVAGSDEVRCLDLWEDGCDQRWIVGKPGFLRTLEGLFPVGGDKTPDS